MDGYTSPKRPQRRKMPGEFDYVNGAYSLALRRGLRLKFGPKAGAERAGKCGTVAKGDGQYIMILIDGDLKPSGPFHPTWEIEYDKEPVKS